MSKQGIHIRDINSVDELHNIIIYSAESMANIEENVSRYINGVKDVLEEQLVILGKRVEEAENYLREAEKNLSSCESRQHYDEEKKEYIPDCSSYEREVQHYRNILEKCKRQYEEGRNIVDECEREIDDYNCCGGLCSPPGGHYAILNMRENQTSIATDNLDQLKKRMEDILSHDMGGEVQEGVMTNPYVSNEDKPMTEEEKGIAFIQAVEDEKDRQREDAYKNNIADANRAMRCPQCGMPFALCTCKNVHGEIKMK